MWTTIRTAILIFFIIGLLLLLPGGCTQSPSTEAPPKTPEELVVEHRVPLSWESKGISADWSNALSKSVEAKYDGLNLAKDWVDVCPRWNSLEKKDRVTVMSELFVAMSKLESKWKPETFYRECNDKKCEYAGGCRIDATYGYCMPGGHKLDGGTVISRGLLQISLESAIGYGCSGVIATPQDLHNPEKNLQCGTIILDKLVKKKGLIIFGSGHYWAVMKPTYKYHPDIVNHLKALPQCK